MEELVIRKAADNIRILSAAMVEKAKSGHPGGAMGGADFIQILYSEYLRFDPDDGSWPFRDRFFLDPGHMSPMLYSTLALCGYYSPDDLKNFRQWGSCTPGHPELDLKRGVENTSGPLGQGHAMAVGAAIAERYLAGRFGEWMSHRIYSFISDGGVQEEISQGAGRIAGYLGLSNLVIFYDSNRIQLSTGTEAVTREDTSAKYQSWGWRVITIDGHDAGQIRRALDAAVAETEKPVLIIGETIMGKGCVTEEGVPFEGKSSTHGQPISKAGASFSKTVENLGGNPEHPFAVFKEVDEYYQRILSVKRTAVEEFTAAEKEWRQKEPEAAARLDHWLGGGRPDLNWDSITCKPGGSTRESSGTVLSYLAQRVDNMIVMSADLANSDKTDGFLKYRKPFGYQDFSGGFLHAGVSELSMAAIANGMALHGGVIPACGTFFVFSDYMKPALRLACLMELPVIYILTHDAFRVGEDGPTHQPVEHEAQMRLMEKLRNHQGNPSMKVFRPADAAETVHCWRLAFENEATPTALLLSRQGVIDLPGTDDQSRFERAALAGKGAYLPDDRVSDPDLLMIGNGSEVATLLEGAKLLKERKGISARVVSAPSEGVFRQQDPAYQSAVIPKGIPVFGLTAGLPDALLGMAGEDSLVWGLDHFGYSAPAEVLDEKFGFTAENVYSRVLAFLESRK